MSIQTVENILHEAKGLSFSEQLTLIQRLLETLRKPSQIIVDTGGISAQQRLQQILAKPARRKLKSLELDTHGFQFDREEANER
jgi:RNase adaptor protein for sRNA GlmZ degradation